MSNRFWNEFTADQWCRTDGDIVAPLSPDPGQREFNRERTEQQFVGNGPVCGLGVPGPAFNAESHRRMAEGWNRTLEKARADIAKHQESCRLQRAVAALKPTESELAAIVEMMRNRRDDRHDDDTAEQHGKPVDCC